MNGKFNKIRAAHVVLGLLVFVYSHFVRAHDMPEIFSATRIETDVGKTSDRTLESWRADGWIGSDYDRLAWKTEGDVEKGDVSDAEAQLLYSRYVAPFWDFQVGLRHDFEPLSHNYFAMGMRGLAPYGFDVDIAAFVREDGKLFARTRGEYDLLITNRLIVRPYLFGDWAATGSEDDDIKGGLYSIEGGINARYEFARSFAPYIEVARIEHPGAASSESYTIGRLGVRLLF